MKRILSLVLAFVVILSCGICAYGEEAISEDENYNIITDAFFAGDVTDDGKITAADARVILKFAACLDTPSEKQQYFADVNSDGKITATDARIVLRRAAQLSDAATPGFENINNASLSLYIDKSGKAIVTYSVYLKNTAAQAAELEIYIEKKTLGVFWKRLEGSLDASLNDRYQTGQFTLMVADEGTYRAVMKLKSGKDKVMMISEYDYSSAILGDVNADGYVTAIDARLALRFASRLQTYTEAQKKQCDMDKNGKITSADARRILRISAKIE